ncbi:hypothetical protein ACOMHN_011669 [Nucella lapillus]
MGDSVKAVGAECQNRIHSKKPLGHMHKGHNSVAANATIPTKYQTIVTNNSEKKGFLSKAKRFISDIPLAEYPAPCQYVNHHRFDMFSPSFSQKGTGAFPSKDKRGTRFMTSNAPGPGIYSLPSPLTSRNDFSTRSVTNLFAAPVADHTSKTNGIPAPNLYNVTEKVMGKVNNVTADAAFKSKSKREMMSFREQSRLPAPGQYDIKDDVTYKNVKVPFSSFKSQSKREMMGQPASFPGPGHYRPHESVVPAKRMIFPHYLCISAPAMPLPELPPMPGPGSYEVADYEGPSKHFMSGSVFMSTTNRWSGKVAGAVTKLPGPAYYTPAPMGRQSFIYNAAGRWL